MLFFSLFLNWIGEAWTIREGNAVDLENSQLTVWVRYHKGLSTFYQIIAWS